MEPNEIQMGLAAAVEEVLETMCFTSVLGSGEGTAPGSGEGDFAGAEGTALAGSGAGTAAGGGEVGFAGAEGTLAGCGAGDLAGGEGTARAERGRTVAGLLDEGVPEDRAAARASACTAELSFRGDPSGQCRVTLPWDLARVLGAGFLGCEETDVSDYQTEEVVCELANMICGSVLSRLEGETTFQITHPELVRPERGAWYEGAGINRWFDLGDGILTVSLELQRTT